MTVTREEHLEFWRAFARSAGEEVRDVQLLKAVREQMPESPFAPAIDSMIRELEEHGGERGMRELWTVMAAQSEFFSYYMAGMLAAGTLGATAEKIADWIEDGSLPLPGAEPKGDEQVCYWRMLGRMLDTSIPLMNALWALEHAARGEQLAQATAAMRQAVIQGRTLAHAMSKFGRVFSPQFRAAVAMREPQGRLAEVASQIADALEQGELGRLPGIADEVQEMGKQTPARQLLNAALLWGTHERASDVHIDPTPDGYSRVRLRIDGVLHDLVLPPDISDPRPGRHTEVIDRLKVMARMDVEQRHEPQDGRIEINVSGRSFDFRVSTVPALHGERACIRILSPDAVRFSLEAIGVLEDDLVKVRRLVHLPNGIVLCTGPTGSGKTTLFYSMLQELDRDHSAVMSVEDPVEYEIEGVAQIQVQPQVGLTFARALRSIMRQDPDVILCGEVRDTETANMVAQCALTGHLVLTSLHADTAPGALKRLVDIGVAPFVVNASVAGVISQRLVRILCGECKQPIEVPAHSLPPEAAEFLAARKDATFFGPKGCDACLRTGYRGRTAIHEILIPDDGVRKAVSDTGDEAAILKAALAAGMRTLLIAGLEKAARGITSVQEVLRVAPQRPV